MEKETLENITQRLDQLEKIVAELNQKLARLVEKPSLDIPMSPEARAKMRTTASWGKFFEWAGNIAERDGFHFHQVDPKNTSQTCSSCGQKAPKKLSLSVRTFSCQFCGTTLDRDHNAARNILFKAAAAFRGERWVTNLYETRNTNEARDTGFETAEQLLLFNDLLTSPSL